MEELYNALVEQGKYTKSFEDFKAQFSAPEKTKMLYESLNSSGDYTKSFENFTSQFGFAEKKNQVDTPSDGQEEVTESITETETTPGSSDSLEEQDEVAVIPLVQDDNGDLAPFVEIPPVNQPDSVVVDTEEVEINPELLEQSKSNLELLNSVGYIEAKGQNRNILDVLKEKGDERVDDIIMEKTYPVMENGQVVYKKEEEIAPELLDAMKIYDKSIDDSYKKNYDDVQVDFEDFQRDDIPDADKLQSLKINQEDYLKWDKVNTRQEGSVFKFFKTLLTSEEGDEFEKEQRQYEKVQSYQATVLNGITNDLEKNKAQQKLTTDTQALKELRKEEELLTGNFYETLGTINSAIDLFPKFKELTEETDLKKRRRLFFAAKNGGMNEFEEGVRQKIRMGGGTAVNYATKFFAGIPGFFDQRLSAVGYDKKGLLAGLSDMLSDSAEHYDIDYGATNRSAFIDGKPVTYKGEEFFVDSNGKVYDKETNLLMDGIIGQDAIKEIQQRSKNVPNAELQFTGGSVLDGTTGTLLNLFALIKSGGKVNKALNLEKRLGKKLAGKVGMGLASFTSGVVDNVEDIRSQLMATGMSEKEAMNIAVNAGQAISTLDGVFSGIAGSNEKLLTGFQGIKDQIKNLAINKGKDFTRKQFQQKSVDLLKENAKELFIEELPVYFSEKAINNLVNRRIGNDVLDDNITRAGITETVVMTIGATSALGSRKLLTGNKRADLVRLAAKNVENLQETLDALVKEGSLTKKEAMSAYTEIYNMQTAENKTKGTIVVSENMQEASDLLTQRQNLINEKQGLEGPLKENIDNRIADVDAQLDALYKRDKQQARDIIKGEQEGTIDVTVTREEALESLKAENEANKRLGLPTILESDENILKEQNKLIKEKQVLTLKDGPDFTKEAVASLKEEGIDDPTLNQVADRAEQLTKQKEDAISKPGTEEQVLPDAPTSTEGGKDSEVELQQVGEGDVEQVTPDTQVQEGETQTDKPSDKTTEGDVEQVTQPTSTEKGMSVNKEKYQVPGSRTIDVEVDKNGKPTVVSRKTGKKVDRVPAKAQDFILTNVVDVNDGARADISEGSTPEQVVDQISENSNNIKEVSETIDQLRKEEENTQESKDVGGELGGLVNQKTRRPAIKFTAKSWKRVTGLSPKESGVSSAWIATEANGGVSIEDGYSDVLSLPGEVPVDTNQRISSDQVVEFIKQYPNATALKEANTSTQLTDLEIKFEQLTGLKATPRNIKTVVGIDPNREPIALTKERSKESTTKESAEKESEGVSKLRDALRKSGTTVKRNTAEQISKLGKQIENAKKALSKILPDVEIIMPSSEAEYKRLTGESADQNSGGTYIDGKIYINPNRASSRVVSHEVFHAVLLSKGMSEAQAKAITERMLSAVKKSASKELLDKIDKFSKRYPEALQSEESIAELVGILASEYDTLPKPSQNIVKRWLDKLAKIFGLKPFTDVEVVDLLNTLASKVESGQEVSAKDVKILDGKDSKQKTEARKSSSKPTIEEIVSKGKEIGSSDADIREVAQQEGYANKDTNSEIEKYDTKKREAAQKAEKLFVKGGKIAKSLDFLRRWALSARGFLPKSMQIGKEVLTGAVAANAKQAENNLKDLQRYIKKQKKSVQDKLVQDLNSYMRGDTDIDTLPAKLRPIAYAMRNHIDSLSMSLVESGAITDIKFDELSPKQKKELIKEFGTEEEARKNYKSQKDNIIDNLGSYLNRSFEVFDNKDYSPSDAVLNAAKAKLREQYMESAKEKALEENNDVDAVLEEMVDNALEKILSREEGREFLNSSKLGSKNISVLKEKIDIPAEIRALMGEYTDPALNYVRSVNKIAALVANQEFLSEMKKAGEGVFFFNKPTGEYNVLIAPKGSKTYNPLNGMYTSKAIKDVVLNTPGATINDSVLNNLLNFYYKMVGIVKYSKTILSPATHAKNVIGNLFFMAYNGYTNPKVYFDAANVVFSDLRSKDKKNHREKMQEYIKAGIINQSSNLGEIRALLQNEGSLEDIMVKRINSDSTLFERLNRIRKKIGKGAEATYQAEDDVFKIISFEMEKKRYSKALFNKTFDKLSPEQQKEVTDKVTEIVKNILPNYSRIGGIGKFLKAVPIAGTFISFQIEAMRTAYNVANLALSELKDINTAGIGVKRLTGILSVTALKAAILPMLGVAGQTLTEAIKSAIGDEEEEEEKEGDIITKSARHFLPKWAENSNIIITKLDNGKFEYVNFSASDPHGFIDKAIISAFRGETAVQGMGNAIISLTEPFVTPDILFKAITSTETDYGKQIFNETDTPNEIAKKIGGILYTTFEPGGATSARKLFKAYKDEDKSLKNEILGQTTGFKVHTVDFEKQLIFKSLDLRKRVDLASKDYSKAYYERKNKEISEDDLRERYNVSNDKYQSVMKEGVDLYRSALRLGSSRFKIERKMEGYKKLTLQEFSYIRNGKIPKLQKKKRASILD
jgi:hypothetical protein